VTAVLSSTTALANTAAVAALASALTSLVKRAVQFTKAAVSLRSQQLEQDSLDSKAAANFPVALPHIENQVLQELFKGFGAIFSSSSSSSNQLQARASAALLAVVAARSIVQLADAMEAAGPQLLLESHNAAPAFRIGWASAFSNTMLRTRMQFVRCAQQHEHPTCVHLQQHWQTEVVGVVACLCDALRELGLLQPQPTNTQKQQQDNQPMMTLLSWLERPAVVWEPAESAAAAAVVWCTLPAVLPREAAATADSAAMPALLLVQLAACQLTPAAAAAAQVCS
jgi:hypothetical protein